MENALQTTMTQKRIFLCILSFFFEEFLLFVFESAKMCRIFLSYSTEITQTIEGCTANTFPLLRAQCSMSIFSMSRHYAIT